MYILRFAYLLFGDVFLRFASKSSGSGELGGETCLLMLTACSGFEPEATGETADTAIPPRELLANKVPFLGGLPILLPVFVFIYFNYKMSEHVFQMSSSFL